MAHFAELDAGNIVRRVIVADSQEWCETHLGGRWVQTSYNTQGGAHLRGGTPLRMNYAGIGYLYDEQRDAFIPPRPYPSWVLNDATCLWESPVPYPTDGKIYDWIEGEGWVEHEVLNA